MSRGLKELYCLSGLLDDPLRSTAQLMKIGFNTQTNQSEEVLQEWTVVTQREIT